eukprot:1721768-Amphidinium_carterae.1
MLACSDANKPPRKHLGAYLDDVWALLEPISAGPRPSQAATCPGEAHDVTEALREEDLGERVCADEKDARDHASPLPPSFAGAFADLEGQVAATKAAQEL